MPLSWVDPESRASRSILITPGLAERDGRGDARGPAEAVAADVEHGESVDLADLAPSR